MTGPECYLIGSGELSSTVARLWLLSFAMLALVMCDWSTWAWRVRRYRRRARLRAIRARNARLAASMLPEDVQ